MRTLLVHQSLYRRILILGAERDPVQFLAFVCFLLAFGGRTVMATAIAVLLWFGVLYCLQRMAKHDQCMTQIFIRHIKQQDFYAARSTPWRKQ